MIAGARLAWGAALLAAGIGTAFASLEAIGADEQPDVYTSDDGARLVYARSYFAGANALTGEDLLKHLPGGPSILRDLDESAGTEQRGFRVDGDLILVDGARITAKSEGVTTVLQRIQARHVRQVEIIRGSVPGLSARSEGTIVNIVLEEGAVTGAGLWELTALHPTGSEDVEYGAQFSYSRSQDTVGYRLALSLTPQHEYRGDQFLLLRDNEPFEYQLGEHVEANSKRSVNAAINYVFNSGAAFGINGSFIDDRIAETVTSDRYSIDTMEVRSFDHSRLKDRMLDSSIWEISGNVEYPWSSVSVLDVLYLSRNREEEDTDDFLSTGDSRQMEFLRQQTERVDYSENVLRAVFRQQWPSARSIEFGAEYANNVLDQRSRKFENQDGSIVDVNLQNADSKVMEQRLELVSALGWQLRPGTQAEIGLDAEYSQLKQQGTDISRSRTFFFWRPKANISYSQTDLTQWSASAQRSISQLDFGNFVTRFSDDSQQSDALLAGNPNLVPSKTWRYELAMETRTADDSGTLSVTLYQESIDDHIEQVEVFSGVSGTGNVGSARVTGVETRGSLRSDGFGLPGGLLDGRYLRRDSSVRDPFTGQPRGIVRMNRDVWNISFRQDLGWQSLAYGVTLSDQSATFVSEIDYFQNVARQPVVDGFVELRPTDNLTLRLEGSDLLRSSADRDRYVFSGDRGQSSLEYLEYRQRQFSRYLELTLRGIF